MYLLYVRKSHEILRFLAIYIFLLHLKVFRMLASFHPPIQVHLALYRLSHCVVNLFFEWARRQIGSFVMRIRRPRWTNYFCNHIRRWTLLVRPFSSHVNWVRLLGPIENSRDFHSLDCIFWFVNKKNGLAVADFDLFAGAWILKRNCGPNHWKGGFIYLENRKPVSDVAPYRSWLRGKAATLNSLLLCNCFWQTILTMNFPGGGEDWWLQNL
jgi:hypothetical protein